MSEDVYLEALDRFGRLLQRARTDKRIREPTALILATADARGRPSTRTVLLKDFDQQGFVFYTNRESRKGEQMAMNAWAALCFYWDPHWEQVVIEGPVKQVSKKEADNYWMTRPRLSQLGAWASIQSRPLPSRTKLLAAVSHYESKFSGTLVPRPEYWHGYRVLPHRIEFWKGRPFRLNDRLLYEKTNQKWKVCRLYP